MKYTEQQQCAIDARDSSIIVSAAAGSGKTAVLTERLTQLISDPLSEVRADRIVVVTFTNDAAAEMKKRLDKSLRERINLCPDNKYLLKQQVLLQNARISTINSFCFELIRDNITDQGITSGFEILDETDEKVIKSQAMEELFDFFSDKEYEKISFLYDCFCLKDYKSLIDVIYKTDEFLSSVAISEKWFEKVIAEYEKDFESSVYYSNFFDNMQKNAMNIVRELEKNYEMIKYIFFDTECKKAKDLYLQASEEIEKAKFLLNIIKSRRIPNDSEKAYILDFQTLANAKGAEYNDTMRKNYQKRRDSIKKSLKIFVENFGSIESDFEESKKAAEILIEVVKKFREIVWEKKCAKNAISFADGERLALELLVDYDEKGSIIQSETAKRISDYYDIIMIDEYQDSNNKQDLIFKLISKNYKLDENNNSVYGDNAFLVGDVKQSIYRFRLANPKNFIDVMNSSKPYEKNSGVKNQSINLNMNFRSSEEVINFANFIFSEIMSENCGDIEYNDNEKLYYGATQYSGKHEENRLAHIMFVNTDIVENDDVGEAVESPEAEIVAEKIAKMINSGYPVVQKDSKKEKCKPKDFCILVRKNFYTSAYVNALNRRGIPAKGSDEKGYLKSQEIAILLDLLRIIANPLQDIPMAVVMLSPMYMFSIEEFSYIRSIDTKKMIYQILIEIANDEIPDFDVKLAEKCREFLKSIKKFRLDSITMTIGELITSIYDTTDFMSVMQIHKDGEKKRANLRMLIQYAHNYESFAAADGRGGLTGFIHHIDRLSETGDYNQGKSAASSDDYVVVQTIHKSKGLEYPFVFICETSSNFKFDNDSVMFSDNGRIGFTLYDKKILRRYKTFQYTLLKDENRRDSRSEEMRLLYVAMTRAKQQLFITLKCGENALKKANALVQDCVLNNSNIENIVEKANCFSDWLWLCLMMHSEFPAIADCIGITSDMGFPAYDTSETLFDYEYFSDASLSTKIEDEEFVPSKPDEFIVEQLKDIFHTDYDRRLSETTAKLSVTQIAKKLSDTEEFELHLQRPKFISGKRKLTGSERGTALHTFFQYCDFDNAVADTEKEVERLKNTGFLTVAQAECIETEKVLAFFESDLYRRIKSAKNYERERKFMVSAAELETDNPVIEKIKDSDNMIKGIIDIMYEESDGIVIVDYKSDRGVSAKELKEKYSRQLEIYKSAIELITGKKVKGLVIYSIELKKEIAI